MKITVLAENTACREDVFSQHGLSLYIEANGHKILFDMGQDATFARNASILGIDLAQVDMAVVSHGHYDHGGGLAEFLQINSIAPVYIHSQAFGAYYNGTDKYIGLEHSLQNHPRLHFTQGSVSLPGGMQLKDCNALDWSSDSWGLLCKRAGEFIPDRFAHEQYLQIREGEKQYLISGCSHKGIVNIASEFQPDVLIGGFHLSKQEDECALSRIAEKLLAGNTRYYTGHCTGSKQYAYLHQLMGERLQSLSTGTVLEI